MNENAVFHMMDSAYSFPVSDNEMVIRIRTAKDDVRHAYLVYESKYVIAKKQKTVEMRKAYTGRLFDFFEIKLKLKDVRFAYVFRLDDGKKKYWFSEDGITETYDFSLGYYNFFQYPYINGADVMRPVKWLRNARFYQIFVDRFLMGDKEKDKSYINCKWGDKPFVKMHAGGDLKGVIKKLSYIKGLGCNSVYLTPIFESVSNHKYDISDYYKVDPQFGTNEDLQNLVDEAHKRKMYVVLDAVFNHCSENSEMFRDVLKKGNESKYFDWFIIHGDKIAENKKNYETFASCTYMPKLNTSNPEVQDFLIGIAVHYVENVGIDGWRLDVSDEISHDFWRRFRREVKAAGERVGREIAIIGENWHDASNYLRGDQYDSIMNYAFTKACKDFFAEGTMGAQEVAWKLNEILMRNTSTVNDMMMNLLDCHDTVRFITDLKGNRSRMKAALALLYMFPGAPCIFSGTEILTEGGSDPDCRRCMDWKKAGSDEYKDVRDLLVTLAGLRQKYAFHEGITSICEEKGCLVLKNTDKKREVALVIRPDSYRITLTEGAKKRVWEG